MFIFLNYISYKTLHVYDLIKFYNCLYIPFTSLFVNIKIDLYVLFNCVMYILCVFVCLCIYIYICNAHYCNAKDICYITSCLITISNRKICLQKSNLCIYNDYILIDLHIKAEYFLCFVMTKYMFVFIKFSSNPYILY